MCVHPYQGMSHVFGFLEKPGTCICSFRTVAADSYKPGDTGTGNWLGPLVK